MEIYLDGLYFCSINA